MFVTQKVRISEPSVDTAQLPPLPYNLPLPYLDVDSEESAAQDQNSSTSNEQWDSRATSKPTAGSKKSKARVNLHVRPLIREGVVGSYTDQRAQPQGKQSFIYKCFTWQTASPTG